MAISPTKITTQIAKCFAEFVKLQNVWAQYSGALLPAITVPVPAKRPTAATSRRGRPPRTAKTAAQKSNGTGQTQTATVMSWITKAGITRDALAKACSPGIRPNHVGIAVNRLLRGGQISERGGKLYPATKTPANRQQKTAAEQRATA